MFTFSICVYGEFRMRNSFERKDDEPSLGYVNVMLFVGCQNGSANCNLEIQVKRLGERSGSATYDCLKRNFTN